MQIRTDGKKHTVIKIGIDIGGVIDKLCPLFAVLSNLLVDNGHEVHIITGQEEKDEIKDKLKEWCIKYTHFFSVTDYQRSQGVTITYDAKGTPWMDGEIWDRTKGEYCKREGIDMHFDDSGKYGEFFSTVYARISVGT